MEGDAAVLEFRINRWGKTEKAWRVGFELVSCYILARAPDSAKPELKQRSPKKGTMKGKI